MIAWLLAAALACVPDDAAGWIARLSADGADERLRAQRWLAAHLAPGDYALVAEALAGGDAEVRERLIEALGSDDRHLELAALAATDAREEVRAAGRAAIEELVVRWNPSALELPEPEGTFPDAWVERETRPLTLALGSSSLADALDRLARLGGGPAGIVLDPALDPALFARLPDERAASERATGTWLDVLQTAVAARRLTFEVHGRDPWAGLEGERDDGESARRAAWVRICKRGAPEQRPGAEHVIAWCEGVLRELDPRWNEACARALGALEWPAALRWLEHRWLERGDDAALDGVLLAASRGRVAPALADPANVRALLADADARLAASEPGSFARAERVAAALHALGPTGAGGESIAEVCTERWNELAPASRWLRLVALEGTRGRSPRGEACCTEVLASSAPPALRAQAVHTLVALAGAPAPAPAIADPWPLLAWADARGAADDLVRAITALRAPYPADGARPPRALAALALEWAAHAGATDTAVGELERLATSEADLDALAARLCDWRASGASTLAEDLVLAARAAPARFGPAWLERLELRAGMLDEERAGAVVARLAPLAAPGEADARDLGELCGHPTLGWRAREALVEWIRPEVAADVLGAGLERAVLALRRARADQELAALERRVRERSVRLGHPLTEVLLGPRWPPRPRLDPLDLDALDHHLDL